MPSTKTMKSHFLLLGVLFLLIPLILADLSSDRQALLDFSSKVPHSRRLNWNSNSSVCTSWVGVCCNGDHTRVTAIRLPGVGFLGTIPPGTIGKLDSLKVLSLRSNYFSGDLPSDITSIPTLQFLFLQDNNFSGSIPESLLPQLVALDLSFNLFTGQIPPAVLNLTNLAMLNLQDNLLSGPIPPLHPSRLKILKLSHNKLSGSIPSSLQNFSSSSFVGNSLCGPPLADCTSAFTLSPISSPIGSKPSKKLSMGALVGIIVGGCALSLLVIVVTLVCCLKSKGHQEKNNEPKEKADNNKKIQMSSEAFGSGIQDAEKNKLVFFEGCAYNFDLEDLLRASAEVLGKGSYGTAYKAILDESTTVVVKRLKEVGIAKREFEQNIEIISKVAQHRNVVPLRAYYYSKDEKLLVYDYVAGGSLALLLHGYRGNGRNNPLNWNVRMKILLDIARGILHIHSEGGGGKFIHGNIKSSNVLLTRDLDGLVSDFGLTLMMNFQPAINSRSVGYHAPEVIETRKATQKSDIYSFGVLLLEMLTGKAPVKSPHAQNDVVDLPRWVQSVVREEWTSEVFDSELLRSPNAEEEMVHMLQIALACVARVPDMRPTMEQVVRMIQDLSQADMDDPPSSEERSKDSNVVTP